MASAAGVAIRAAQINVLMTHIMHLAAGGSRAREVFLANITVEWTARDAGARAVHKKIDLLSLAAFAADMTVGATKVNILTLTTHVLQLADREICAWYVLVADIAVKLTASHALRVLALKSFGPLDDAAKLTGMALAATQIKV